MNNKVLMTSILAICVATPAFAEGEIANASGLLQGKNCDESTLGVTEGTANIEAIWTPNTYEISYTCVNGTRSVLSYIRPTDILFCDENPTDDYCITPESAVYGKNFTFGTAGCFEDGYEQTGWSCTRDNVANDTPTIYSLWQQLTPWDIPSNLTCTEVRVGNTITLNWYEDEDDENPTVTECTYGTTSGQGALVLPATPAQRAGYTFSGWRALGAAEEEQELPNCAEQSTPEICQNEVGCAWDSGTCKTFVEVCNSGTSETCDSKTTIIQNTGASSICYWNEESGTCDLGLSLLG